MCVSGGLTIKLSDRSSDVSDPETPRQNPKAKPGSLQRLVRQSKFHRLKNLRPTLSEKRPDGPSGHGARNISVVPTKHTKTNPQRPGECAWSPKSTGGNRVNRGSIPSPLPPWPPVQNLWRRCLRRTKS